MTTSTLSGIEPLAAADAFELALKPMREKRWADASALWKVFREQYRGHPAPWIQGAISLMRQGDIGAAGDLLAFAREHFPKHSSTWLSSAECARLQKNPTLERELLAQGCEQCPEHWELLGKSADLELRTGNTREAENFNSRAREHAQGRIEPLLQHAEIAEHSEDWEQAESRWRRVVEAKPEYSRGYTQLSNACKQQGKLAEAKKYRLAALYGVDSVSSPATVQTMERKSQTSQGGEHFIQLVLIKALLNLKSESSRNHLNYAWVIIEPLLHLIIYYLLFSQVLNSGGDNYGLFLLCGLVPWMWFSKAISMSANSIISGQGLMLNTGIMPSFFPLVAIVQATMKQLPALLFLLALGLVVDEKSLSLNILWLPGILLVQFLLTLALGLLLAAIIPFLRDLANLVATGLTLLMFLSGVIYDYRHIPGGVAKILEYNPMAVLIACYREVVLEGRPPEWTGLIYVGFVALIVMVFDFVLYRHHRRTFVRRCMR
ncbi:ABC transporter permease [Pseudomonas denitrificans (nom. rej.)]|uniref:Transport permease protein n=1 Tax=Pseudomonas denitrificans TaxID=43306 RepID=A0A9X7N2U4_PSEDE|nr:ABC transporter permease [Pseudomonas denitrificans (nom. rej.)]QEY73676.1 hypothetical protein F1C79_19890 [Pseudomonas denitrificans (nom. rej.)]